MNCHSKGLYPGCCRDCPKLRGVSPQLPTQPPMPPPPPVTRSNPMPSVFPTAYIPPAPPRPIQAIPVMAPIPEDENQPSGGKVAVSPPSTAEPETTLPGSRPELEAFLAQNPEKGYLRVQAFRGQQVLPVQGVHVVVSRMFDGQQYIFFEGDTDQSGIIDGVTLPASPRDRSLKPGEPQPSAAYDLTATYSKYQDLKTTVDIYQNVKTTQMIQMLQKLEG